MLEALAFPMSAEKKSEVVRFPPFSAHIEFEFSNDQSGDEFIRVLFQEKPLILDGKEYLRREEFEQWTSWLRMDRKEWELRRTKTYPRDPIVTDEEILTFLRNPMKFL